VTPKKVTIMIPIGGERREREGGRDLAPRKISGAATV